MNPRGDIMKRTILIILLCVAFNMTAAADQYFRVNVDTSPLEGQAGYLAFDFVDGDGAENNQVELTGFTGDVILGSPSAAGDVDGALIPGPLRLGDAEFFNSFLQPLEFGGWLEFDLNVSSEEGLFSVPDTLAFFVLDESQAPLASEDPTGADAKMIIELGADPAEPVIYPSAFVNVSLGSDLAIESIMADPDRLWPPNRRMVPVSLDVVLEDGSTGGSLCAIQGVTSNEPLVENDYEITGPLSVDLRAWRKGQGDGRIYTIEVLCQDGAAQASGTVEVKVPHDQGG